MPWWAGIDIVADSRWVPDLEPLRSAVPLANVVEAQAVIQSELLIRLERILGVNRPLMELEVVGGERTHLLVVARDAEQEVSNHVPRTVRAPTHIVSAVVAWPKAASRTGCSRWYPSRNRLSGCGSHTPW